MNTNTSDIARICVGSGSAAELPTKLFMNSNSIINPELAPCVAVVGPANSGKTTLLHQLDEKLQQRLGAVMVIKGNPDGTGRYLFHAPDLREAMKEHVKGKWGENTVQHICESVDHGRRNLELALLDFGGKHNPDNNLMLSRCSHYILVSRFADTTGASSWDTVCRNNNLERVAWMRSIGSDDARAPEIMSTADGLQGTFRFDANPGDSFNDGVIEPLVGELVSLRRAPDLVPYVDLHDPTPWEENHIVNVRGRAAKIREMATRTGVVLLGGVAPVWAYLAGLKCAIDANQQTRIFFFDPKQPERLVEIPLERRDGSYPPGALELRWTSNRDYARLEFHMPSEDRFLPPACAQNLAFAPSFGQGPYSNVCLWGKAPTWIYGTYARWLLRARVDSLSSFDGRKTRAVRVWPLGAYSPPGAVE